MLKITVPARYKRFGFKPCYGLKFFFNILNFFFVPIRLVMKKLY